MWGRLLHSGAHWTYFPSTDPLFVIQVSIRLFECQTIDVRGRSDKVVTLRRCLPGPFRE